MSYVINPVEADQCIFLEYEGTVPPRQVIAARDSAAGLLAARRWNRIVADITEIRTLPLTREFFILYVLVRGLARKIPPSARVALVIRPEQELQARFIESVARKDGVFLTCFFDPEAATAWVKGMNSPDAKLATTGAPP